MSSLPVGHHTVSASVKMTGFPKRTMGNLRLSSRPSQMDHRHVALNCDQASHTHTHKQTGPRLRTPRANQKFHGCLYIPMCHAAKVANDPKRIAVATVNQAVVCRESGSGSTFCPTKVQAAQQLLCLAVQFNASQPPFTSPVSSKKGNPSWAVSTFSSQPLAKNLQRAALPEESQPPRSLKGRGHFQLPILIPRRAKITTGDP